LSAVVACGEKRGMLYDTIRTGRGIVEPANHAI